MAELRNSILKFSTYSKVTMNLGKTYEELRRISRSFKNRGPEARQWNAFSTNVATTKLLNYTHSDVQYNNGNEAGMTLLAASPSVEEKMERKTPTLLYDSQVSISLVIHGL